MNWILTHKRNWRTVALALLVIGLLGPWAFELLSVPAESACQYPSIRLNSEYCGLPVSGLRGVVSFIIGIFILVIALIAGALKAGEIGRDWLGILFWLPLLPLISSLLVILRSKEQRWPVFHLAALALTATCVGLYTTTVPADRIGFAWGLWLFLAALVAGLGLEIIAASRFRPPA